MPGSLPALDHIHNEHQWRRYMQAQYHWRWKLYFAKTTKGAWHGVKYLGCYLKRPPVSAYHLQHFCGGAVIRHYLDHWKEKHKRQTLSKEEIIGRYVSHVPARHVKMVRSLDFLANRKWGTWFPLV